MSEMILTPVMTSNTEPSGVCSSSSNYSGSYGTYYPYMAFRQFNDPVGLSNHSWLSVRGQQAIGQWIQYTFPSGVKKCVNKVEIFNRNEPNSTHACKQFIFQGSNDGTNWTDLTTCNINSDQADHSQSFIIDNSEKYNAYRLYVTDIYDSSTNIVGFGCINLYYIDDIVKPLVPAMTSNTTPKGECFGSGANQSASNYQFYHAFCGDNTKFWANDGNPTGYIGYDFGKPVRCYRFRFNPLTYHTAATITYKIQATNDINGTWTDVSELQTTNTSSAVLYNGEYSVNAECSINPGNGYRYYRYKQESTNYGNSNGGAMQFYGTDETPHLKSSGSTEAIRDWLNASLYNKEEIDDLFIRNNQSGLIPYDLMITGDQPEQMIKLVGQTSGKTYNICLAAILGDDMKETVLWENSGTTRPSTITLNDDWTKYKWLIFCTTVSLNSNRYLETYIYPTSFIKKAIQNNSGATIALCFNANSSDYLWYSLSNNTLTYMDAGGNNPIPTSILGYS